jgi:hypothetical protein
MPEMRLPGKIEKAERLNQAAPNKKGEDEQMRDDHIDAARYAMNHMTKNGTEYKIGDGFKQQLLLMSVEITYELIEFIDEEVCRLQVIAANDPKDRVKIGTKVCIPVKDLQEMEHMSTEKGPEEIRFLIDLALQTNDQEWFMQLTQELIEQEEAKC